MANCQADLVRTRVGLITLLLRLKDLLVNQLDVARINLIAAADKGPMYGTLGCIR